MIFTHRRAPLIVGTLLITLIVGFMALFRSSPGDLSRPHAQVAGFSMVTDCRKCHAEQGLATGCLGCHEEIAGQLSGKRGYHHHLLKDKKTECARCHREHNGKDFPLINEGSWEGADMKKFNHPHTTFTLAGKHDGLACDKCHASKNVKPFTLPDFPSHKRTKTFLGLTQKCADCHEDVHADGLSPDCAKCHDQNAWRPAPLFDHNKFYPLTGGHARVSCAKCHPLPAAGEPPRTHAWAPFDQVKGTSCRSCHKSPHRTDWKTDCETCHSRDAVSWKTASAKMPRALHAATVFRLNKPHDRVACEKCHGADLSFEKKYPDPRSAGYKRGQKSCEGCHKDVHAGQFLPKHTRCADCHKEICFKPAQFGVKDHGAYPLTGAHAAVPCSFCHKTNAQTGVKKFAGVSKECHVCHRDEHRGQFQNNGRTTCETCHKSFVSWNKTTFNHETQSRFKLDQAHAKIACDDCHPRVRIKDGTTLIQYKPLRRECKDCHGLNIPK